MKGTFVDPLCTVMPRNADNGVGTIFASYDDNYIIFGSDGMDRFSKFIQFLLIYNSIYIIINFSN